MSRILTIRISPEQEALFAEALNTLGSTEPGWVRPWWASDARTAELLRSLSLALSAASVGGEGTFEPASPALAVQR